MESNSPVDPDRSVCSEGLCQDCKSSSRLPNGLCLNCLLLAAIDRPEEVLGPNEFTEALLSIDYQEGDWNIGDHKILDEIARGGMGVIYRAEELRSGRIVALKCILKHSGQSEQALVRFRREAETIARLDHPNIVPIYRVGEAADGSPFFTMKYTPNGSLLNARGLDTRQSVLLIAKVATAIQYAHNEGIFHRDLKPGNILLDSRGEPLVSDFGLARWDKCFIRMTLPFASFGTPGYMAPEHLAGTNNSLTCRADIYSLGAILFELVTGRLPFLGENVLSIIKQSTEKTAPRLRTIVPHLDRDLEVICARCLEREPLDRYSSAGALAQDLMNWHMNYPITIRPVGMLLRSKRWMASNM